VVQICRYRPLLLINMSVGTVVSGKNMPLPSSVADKHECWDCSLWYNSVTVTNSDHMRMYGRMVLKLHYYPQV
jgi:hypothetical protein